MARKKKYSPTFPAHIKPVHPGVYQCLTGNHWVDCYRWDGYIWMFGQFPSVNQNRRWRGLASKP